MLKNKIHPLLNTENDARTLLLRTFRRPAREIAEGERWKEVEIRCSKMTKEGSSQASALVPYGKESRRRGGEQQCQQYYFRFAVSCRRIRGNICACTVQRQGTSTAKAFIRALHPHEAH